MGAYVIQQMADRLFSVGNRCSALLAFTQMLQVFLMGNSCVYAIDMVKLRCGWFNPSDIYKIGGSVMFRFMQKQSGLSHFGFWPSPSMDGATQNLSCGRISQTVVKSAYALFAVW